MNADSPKSAQQQAKQNAYSFRFRNGGYQIFKTNEPGKVLAFKWKKDEAVQLTWHLNAGRKLEDFQQ